MVKNILYKQYKYSPKRILTTAKNTILNQISVHKHEAKSRLRFVEENYPLTSGSVGSYIKT